jgi:hypothetical protein
MSESLTITIPGTPDRALSPNGRVHHMARHRAARDAKTVATYATYAALGNGEVSDETMFWLLYDGPIRFDVAVYWGKGQKRWDDDNLTAALKAYRDGVAANFGRGDGHFHTGTVSQKRDKDGRGYTVVTITQEDA